MRRMPSPLTQPTIAKVAFKTQRASSRSSAWCVTLFLPVLICGCYRNVFASEFDTCEEVNAEMKDELASLQACSIDADCGLILEGTSCGCTNELVAHKEYDTTRFRALQGRGEELKCNGAVTDCSCPATDGFVCTNGTCGWNYVP
jgi:hypothetical protein